jgi:uncharacterized protein
MGVTIDVWVVPGASRSEFVGLHGDKVKLRVAEPAEGGRANEEARRLLEGLLGAPVSLIRGMTNRHKVFQVSDSDTETVRRKLGLV